VTLEIASQRRRLGLGGNQLHQRRCVEIQLHQRSRSRSLRRPGHHRGPAQQRDRSARRSCCEASAKQAPSISIPFNHAVAAVTRAERRPTVHLRPFRSVEFRNTSRRRNEKSYALTRSILDDSKQAADDTGDREIRHVDLAWKQFKVPAPAFPWRAPNPEYRWSARAVRRPCG
jgi:hypothetical protein